MIYLALVLAVACWLLIRWSRLQARHASHAALVAGMSKAEAQAEYDRCRAQLSARLAARSAMPGAAASRGAPGAEAQLAPERAEIETLAERGAWMMDRIRGLEGAQTGPAPRIRAKMELIDAAAQDAHCAGNRGREQGLRP